MVIIACKVKVNVSRGQYSSVMVIMACNVKDYGLLMSKIKVNVSLGQEDQYPLHLEMNFLNSAHLDSVLNFQTCSFWGLVELVKTKLDTTLLQTAPNNTGP